MDNSQKDTSIFSEVVQLEGIKKRLVRKFNPDVRYRDYIDPGEIVAWSRSGRHTTMPGSKFACRTGPKVAGLDLPRLPRRPG